MTGVRRTALVAYAWLASLFPCEFRRRHRGEMQLDFEDQMHASVTPADVVLTAGRAYGDLVISLGREWLASEALRLLISATLAHAGIWLMAVAIAAWQWPGGAALYPVVLTFALLSAPGVALAVWRQRLHVYRRGCSLGVAELD